MLKELKILALIPARGGSKGIKEKNITPLCGRPLIAYTIDAALQSKYIDDVVVTTDSEKIADIALQSGAQIPFLRPKELASDSSSTLDAVLHAIGALKNMDKIYDILILLQPTQPLRTSEDIDLCLEHYYQCGMQDMVSVCEVDDHPLLIRSIDEKGKLVKLLNTNSTCRRQDMPKYYRVNGCIYVNAVSRLDRNTSFNDNPMPFVMEKSHSVDIDETKDLYLAEWYLLKQRGRK